MKEATPMILDTKLIDADPDEAIADELGSRIRRRTAQVAVLGLGYVGLPLAMAFADAGFRVTGIDVDEAKVERLARGQSHVTDVEPARVAAAISDGRFLPTPSFDALAACDCIVVCVPTPLGKTREPDVSAVIQAGDEIARRVRTGQLIVLESTTYPGTTEELLLPCFQASGLQVGQQYYLAYSPERIDPGNKEYGIGDIPKIVGGVTEECTRMAQELYTTVIQRVHPVSGARVAEMAKLLENTFRSVNIALVNELALMCHSLGVDVWEVIAAASTKPFAFLPHYPGPGIGGHCIPLDPHYLAWRARLAGFEPRFIGLASEVNAGMPYHVIQRVEDALNSHKKCVNGTHNLVLGVAYKPGVSDTRETPALTIITELQKRGAIISYNDPFVPQMKLGDQPLVSCELTEEALRAVDCVLIVTNHPGYDWDWVARTAPLIVDTRNALSGIPINGHTIFKL
jgi:UDP-N-acetyl-D-glucosamine dehydrogenase